MKKCPVCGAECFDDMETCFECLHSFTHDAQEEKTPIEKMKEAAENSRVFSANQPQEQMFEPNQQDSRTYAKPQQHEQVHANNFSYTFGGHEEGAEREENEVVISTQVDKINKSLNSEPRDIQNTESCDTQSRKQSFEHNIISKCMPKEIVADGRFGDIRCTVLDSISSLDQSGLSNDNAEQEKISQTSNYNEDEEGVQTWVLRLSLPADCEGVTVRLERA